MSPSVKSAKGVGGTGARARPTRGRSIRSRTPTTTAMTTATWRRPAPAAGVRITALVLSLLGLADSTYLTITHFQKHLLDVPDARVRRLPPRSPPAPSPRYWASPSPSSGSPSSWP